MRVLIVTPGLPPEIGGIERHSHELALGLSAEGHEVEVLTGGKQDDDWDLKNESGIRIFYIRTNKAFGLLPLPKISIKNFKLLVRLGRRHIDLIIVQSHVFPLSIMTSFLFRKNKILWINHGSSFFKWHVPLIGSLSVFYEKIGLFVMKRCSRYIASVSIQAAGWLSKNTNKTGLVLSNGIPRDFQQLGENSQIKESKDRIRILFVGRLIEDKGCLNAIEIVENANNFYREKYGESPFELTIVGTGPLNQVLQKNNATFVKFRGGLSHQAVADLMLHSDLLLFPSRYSEGFPTVILEAAVLGLGVLTSNDMPGIDLFKLDGGVVVGNDCELSQTLFSLRENKDELMALKQKAKATALANFTWGNIVKELLMEVTK